MPYQNESIKYSKVKRLPSKNHQLVLILQCIALIDMAECTPTCIIIIMGVNLVCHECREEMPNFHTSYQNRTCQVTQYILVYLCIIPMC